MDVWLWDSIGSPLFPLFLSVCLSLLVLSGRSLLACLLSDWGRDCQDRHAPQAGCACVNLSNEMTASDWPQSTTTPKPSRPVMELSGHAPPPNQLTSHLSVSMAPPPLLVKCNMREARRWQSNLCRLTCNLSTQSEEMVFVVMPRFRPGC